MHVTPQWTSCVQSGLSFASAMGHTQMVVLSWPLITQLFTVMLGARSKCFTFQLIKPCIGTSTQWPLE